jgi:hypothetical protein
MAKPFLRVLLIVLAALAVRATTSFAEQVSPEETLKRYLTAIQANDFDKAYDLVSKAMKMDRKTGQERTREAWVKQSQYIISFSEAKIFDFKVGSGKIEGDKATVPNLLSSQDKFLNQLGVEEYEVYTLLKEDGAWKVDHQMEVVEQSEIDRWFPKKK